MLYLFVSICHLRPNKGLISDNISFMLTSVSPPILTTRIERANNSHTFKTNDLSDRRIEIKIVCRILLELQSIGHSVELLSIWYLSDHLTQILMNENK